MRNQMYLYLQLRINFRLKDSVRFKVVCRADGMVYLSVI